MTTAPILNAARLDPLGLNRLRGRYQRDLDRRMRRVASLLHRSIVQKRAFGPKLNQARLADENEFAGPDELAEDAFFAYVNEIEEIEILEEGSDAYWALILAIAYKAGTRQAHKAAAQVATSKIPTLAQVQRATVHRQALKALENRHFELLKNMTLDTAADLKAVMREALASGVVTRNEMAGRITSKVASISKTRAAAIAATEITAAHAQATLNTFEALGIARVTGLVEFTLNVHGSAEPCPECEALAGNVYRLEEAAGLIPLHVNCQSFASNTELYTRDGWQWIEQIKIGDECLSLKVDSFSTEYAPVALTHRHHADQMVHFEAKALDLLVTPDHDCLVLPPGAWWVERERWFKVKAMGVKHGDRFCGITGSSEFVTRLESKQIISYDDDVFCVTLAKNHTVWARRNGKTVWVGNCGWLPLVD